MLAPVTVPSNVQSFWFLHQDMDLIYGSYEYSHHTPSCDFVNLTYLEPLLLTWFIFDPSMDKYLYLL